MCAQVGVELVERTGRNPQNLFIQLGCSKMAEQKMLHYVRTQCVGKPFSNYAMVRSLFWPRETTHESFFCAELVASILKVGGLLDANCNPGSATPEMLFRIYSPRAAVAANPVLLREMAQHSPAATNGIAGTYIGNVSHAERLAEREALVPRVPSATGGIPMSRHGVAAPRMSLVAPQQPVFQASRKRSESPPRGHFQVVNKQYLPLGSAASACTSRCPSGGIQLTMNSLQFGGAGSSSGSWHRPR